MKHKLYRGFISIITIGILAFSPVSAQAAGGCNVGEILDTVKNPNAPGEFPIRRGFFDGEQGFGYDKAYHKHGLRNIEAIKKVGRSPLSSWEGNSLVARAYAGTYTCGWWGRCTLQDEREIRVVFTVDAQYGDMKFDSQLGLLTAYCKNPDNAPLCPDWVESSILYPETNILYGQVPNDVFSNSYKEGSKVEVFSYEQLPEIIGK